MKWMCIGSAIVLPDSLVSARSSRHDPAGFVSWISCHYLVLSWSFVRVTNWVLFCTRDRLSTVVWNIPNVFVRVGDAFQDEDDRKVSLPLLPNPWLDWIELDLLWRQLKKIREYCEKCLKKQHRNLVTQYSPRKNNPCFLEPRLMNQLTVSAIFRRETCTFVSLVDVGHPDMQSYHKHILRQLSN